MGCIFRAIKHGHQTALEFLNCCPFSVELNMLTLVFKVIQNGSTEYHVKTGGLFRSRTVKLILFNCLQKLIPLCHDVPCV